MYATRMVSEGPVVDQNPTLAAGLNRHLNLSRFCHRWFISTTMAGVSTGAASKPPLLIITYPRTASNLLLRLLALPDQDKTVSDESGGYFFFPAVAHMKDAGLLDRPRAKWTEEEVYIMEQKYQSCCDSLHELLVSAEQSGKMVVNKEHAPFMASPYALSEFIHGQNEASLPWKVAVPESQCAKVIPGLATNDSVLPDGFLLRCTPAFIIRHPALSFPSYYRVILSFCDGDQSRVEEIISYVSVACTVRWTKSIYDWYTAAWAASGSPKKSPAILDADDFITNPDLATRFCTLLGLDPTKVQFTWDPLTESNSGGVDPDRVRARASLLKSSGIAKGKTFDGLTIESEAIKWKEEFGEAVGSRLEKWVRSAMPDYEYLRGRRLTMDSSL